MTIFVFSYKPRKNININELYKNSFLKTSLKNFNEVESKKALSLFKSYFKLKFLKNKLDRYIDFKITKELKYLGQIIDQISTGLFSAELYYNKIQNSYFILTKGGCVAYQEAAYGPFYINEKQIYFKEKLLFLMKK